MLSRLRAYDEVEKVRFVRPVSVVVADNSPMAGTDGSITIPLRPAPPVPTMDARTAAVMGIFRQVALSGWIHEAAWQTKNALEGNMVDPPAKYTPQWWALVERSAQRASARADQASSSLRAAGWGVLEALLGPDHFDHGDHPLAVGIESICQAARALADCADEVAAKALARSDNAERINHELWKMASAFKTDVETSDFLSNQPSVVHGATGPRPSAFSHAAIAKRVSGRGGAGLS